MCDLHFEERFLLRRFVANVNGETVEIERAKWSLTVDAVPTVFPIVPKYLSKNLPKPRHRNSHRREGCSSVTPANVETGCVGDGTPDSLYHTIPLSLGPCIFTCLSVCTVLYLCLCYGGVTWSAGPGCSEECTDLCILL